jgi:hypothetical protein
VAIEQPLESDNALIQVATLKLNKGHTLCKIDFMYEMLLTHSFGRKKKLFSFVV